MVTLNEQEAVLPAASVTMKVLTVVPTGKAEPEGRPAIWVVTAPGQLSVPIGAVQFTIAEHCPDAADCVMLPGQLITGVSVSTIVTVYEHVVETPQVFVAVYVTVVTPILKLRVPHPDDLLDKEPENVKVNCLQLVF